MDSSKKIFTSRIELMIALHSYINEPVNSLDIDTWDVSQITNMSNLFSNMVMTEEHNSRLVGISKWNVSNVTNMSYMFYGCTHFNQPLKWDVSNVKDMSYMFKNCNHFNLPLSWNEGPWNVSNVTSMSHMFDGCTYFNQALNWNVSKVTSMEGMFKDCQEFNQILNDWDVSSVTNFSMMFFGAIKFNSPLNKWDTTGKKKKLMFSKQNNISPFYLPKGINPPVVKSVIDLTEANIPIVTELSNLPEIKKSDMERWRKITKKPVITAGEFIKKYPDYLPFIKFIHTTFKAFSPNEYKTYYSKIKMPFFIHFAPTGYSINDVPDSVVGKKKPFYDSLKYLYKKIERFNPSGESINNKLSEYSYSIHLGRLIYYYNLFIALEDDNLSGIENTGGVIVLCKGAYRSPDDVHKLSGSLENIYVYSKAAYGCLSYNDTNTNNDTAKLQLDETVIDKMYDSIKKYHVVPFDEIFMTSDECSLSKTNCRVKSDYFGSAMTNNISPRVDAYINKKYSGSVKDGSTYIIDIQKYHAAKLLYPKPNQIKERFNYANILYIPQLLGFSKLFEVMFYTVFINYSGSYIIINNYTWTVHTFSIQLKDILNYYISENKRNLFIYDTSCGVWSDLVANNIWNIFKPSLYYAAIDERKNSIYNKMIDPNTLKKQKEKFQKILQARVKKLQEKHNFGGTRRHSPIHRINKTKHRHGKLQRNNKTRRHK